MNEIDPAYALYVNVATSLRRLKNAVELAEEVEWFADSKAAPHLDSAAQGVFVTLERLRKELVSRYGEDFEQKLSPETELKIA